MPARGALGAAAAPLELVVVVDVGVLAAGRLLDAVAAVDVDALRAVALCVCKARLVKRRAKLNISILLKTTLEALKGAMAMNRNIISQGHVRPTSFHSHSPTVLDPRAQESFFFSFFLFCSIYPQRTAMIAILFVAVLMTATVDGTIRSAHPIQVEPHTRHNRFL